MPKKTVDTDSLITVNSSQGTDSISLGLTSSSSQRVSTNAEDIFSSNALGGYLDENLQSNLDNLSSEAKRNQPPKLGYGAITFSNDLGVSISHDGRPDWGSAKVVDYPSWVYKKKIWAEKREMPHIGFGNEQEDLATSISDSKWINEGGLYDTLNLNYRDNRETGSPSSYSYYGFGDTQFDHIGFPLIAQSAPRDSFNLLDNSQIYPFLYQEPLFTPDETNDLFNASTGITLGLTSGEGTSSFGLRKGEPAIAMSPISTRSNSPFNSKILIDSYNDDLGFVISGLLFPADRGVLALIRFESDPNGVSSGISTPATNAEEVLNRVVAAIKLGHGVGSLDGEPGGDIFNDSEGETFPSLKTGQYDLYELHTGNYIPNSTRSGANPNLVADPTKGQVRLLTDPLAFNVEDNTYSLGIPVLFSPYDYSREVEARFFFPNRNFLSYRMPLLKDYSPEGLLTPVAERDRFFVKNTPNKDQAKKVYDPLFKTAGGYVTFGARDNYSYQVARYRHVVNLMDLEADTYVNISSDPTEDEPDYNFGSFALIHFKTEAAFERLVRDGIAPSDEEVFSRNLIDFDDLSNNIAQDLGTVGGDGLEDGVSSFSSSNALSIFRPNFNFERPLFDGLFDSFDFTPKAQTENFYPNYDAANSEKINKNNSYFSFISGVIYVSPTIPFRYNGHPDLQGNSLTPTVQESLYSKIKTEFNITQELELNDLTKWDTTEPSENSSVRPFAQILASSLTAQDNLEATVYTQCSVTTKHQSLFVNQRLGVNTLYAKGDAVKPITDLTLMNEKDGFCTLSTSATRTSLLVNRASRQHDNIGVEIVADDVETLLGNPVTNNSKVLYHSARKISLLELYGQRFRPNGSLPGFAGTSISSLSEIYTPFGDVGYPGGENDDFTYGYVFAWWENTNNTGHHPKVAGQSFSIYRYDEEGYRIYQELELLPIGGDEANGYALELCSGWNRVSHADNNVNTDPKYRYPQNRPVYRPVENNDSRLAVTTHADARFLLVKDVDYYIECYPSVPYTAASPLNPLNFDETTANQSISSIGGSAYSDLQLKVVEELNPAQSVWNAYAGTNSLYDNLAGVNTNQCQWLGKDTLFPPPVANPVADVGYTSHVRGIKYLRRTSLFSYESSIPHPHPRPSYDLVGEIHYGDVFIEVAPTGNMELPEYGNFTQDIRGFITVSGLGNEPYFAEDQIHAVAPTYNPRIPLKSLFTRRKDTQERFLDESYRIESSLQHLLTVVGDPTSSARYSNNSVANFNPALPDNMFNSNTDLIENLQGPGLPNGGAGVNSGYICFPVRDESTFNGRVFLDLLDSFPADDLFRKRAGHGGAGYLRNSWHIRRAAMSTDPLENDWREAQVIGFPDMTRNLMSGSKYGTPPRGLLVYPYMDFSSNAAFSFEGQTTGANNLIASNEGYFLPNANIGSTDTREGSDWVDDDLNNAGFSLNPKLRHAQPNYYKTSLLSDFADPNDYPDVGYVRAFDLNFGKNPTLTPQAPYWNKNWVEDTEQGEENRTYLEAQNYGLIESGQWIRAEVYPDERGFRFAPVNLRLVGIDWDMISFVDRNFPLQKRDGLVHEVSGSQYLCRKRVMRVFVKVPGLTAWLDVGVKDGEIGESYRHWTGDKSDPNVGNKDPNGATSRKDDPLVDGAGCCLSYEEKYLVEEGLACLDLKLNLGFVPAFNSWGADTSLPVGDSSNISKDEYLGFSKEYRVDNCPTDTIYLRNQNNLSSVDSTIAGAKNFEAPILVKVVLSHPDHPKYEVHPDDNTKLVNATDISDLTLEIADIANGTPNNVSIIDIHPSPNTSYLGHSYPPDDRAPLWSRRGLMGIEVLRPDGSNFDRDEAIDRPDFTSIDLYGNPTLYYARTEDLLSYESYVKQSSSLTNKITYTHNLNVAPTGLSSEYKKPVKGEG